MQSRLKKNEHTHHLPINENITCKVVKLIDQDGVYLGEKSREEALALSSSLGLDLFIENNNVYPPIARIIEYGKYVYEKKRKLKENKKAQLNIKVKKIQVRPQTSEHDLNWRIENAKKWLADNFRVIFIIKTYGRIATKQELIHKTYQQFISKIESFGEVQVPLKKISSVMYEAHIVSKKSAKKNEVNGNEN